MAAVAVVTVIGISLIGSLGGLAGRPTLAPTLTPGSSGPSDEQSRLLPASGPIVAGGYDIPWPAATDSTKPARRISLTIPPGWLVLRPGTLFSSNDVTTISRFATASSPTLILSLGHLATDVVVDACAGQGNVVYRPVGPTVDDLITALVQQRGTHKLGPSTVQVAGFRAKLMVVWMTSADPCSGPEGRLLWVNGPDKTLPDANNIVSDSFGLLKDGESTIYVVDVDGQRLVIGITERGAATLVGEVNAILDSIQILPAP